MTAKGITRETPGDGMMVFTEDPFLPWIPSVVSDFERVLVLVEPRLKAIALEKNRPYIRPGESNGLAELFMNGKYAEIEKRYRRMLSEVPIKEWFNFGNH